MALNGAIASLATHLGITVSRRVEGTYVNGVYVSASPTTFTIDAVIQPAYNLNRIIGGADLDAKVDLQRTDEVRVVYTVTELKTRSPTTDPDVVTFDGADWTAIRVENWNLRGEIHYRVVVTKQTHGAS